MFPIVTFLIFVQLGCYLCIKELNLTESDPDAEQQVYYFAYNSNMMKKNMERRVKSAQCKGPAYLKNFRLEFDTELKYWYRALATITEDPGSTVWGVLWSIQKFHADAFRRKYNRSTLLVESNVQIFTPHQIEYSAFTHVAQHALKKRPPWMVLPKEKRPSETYLKSMILGAIENDLPKEYIKRLIDIPYNNKNLDDQRIQRFLHLKTLKF